MSSVPACKSALVDVYHTSGVVVRDLLCVLHRFLLEPFVVIWPIINEGYPVFSMVSVWQMIPQVASIDVCLLLAGKYEVHTHDFEGSEGTGSGAIKCWLIIRCVLLS